MILKVSNAQTMDFHTGIIIVKIHAVLAAPYFEKWLLHPSFRVKNWVSKHLDKSGFDQVVKGSQFLPAFCDYTYNCIELISDITLFFNARHLYCDLVEPSICNRFLCGSRAILVLL